MAKSKYWNGSAWEALGTDADKITETNDYKVMTAAERTKLSNLSTPIDYTATITTTWEGTSPPYTQDVTVSGITASDVPFIFPVYSTTNATAILEKEAWNVIGGATTSANTITFTCFEEKPVTAIPIQIRVVR
jgi:hypothetical protein